MFKPVDCRWSFSFCSHKVIAFKARGTLPTKFPPNPKNAENATDPKSQHNLTGVRSQL